jgi:signal peptidase I
MNILVLILFDLFIVWFFFGQSLQRMLAPARWRVLLDLREIERHFRHLLRRDRDILSPDMRDQVAAMAEGIQTLRKGQDGANGLTEEAMASLEAKKPFAGFVKQLRKEGFAVAAPAFVGGIRGGAIGPVLPTKKRLWLRDHLEVAVVALGLAFGVRALFLQPFKIPTGSMQPTLYGIHFIHSDNPPPKLGPVGRFFGYLHYSRRYVDLEVKESGYLDTGNVRSIRHSIPLQNWLLPECTISIGGESYVVPGNRDTVEKYLEKVVLTRQRAFGGDAPGALERALYFRKGERLLRGYLELGDHLFVDRTYLPFHEPKRGDVTVFRTDGIRDLRGKEVRGPYYIKRLVGMPGDELRVVAAGPTYDRFNPSVGHLEVRPVGETEFRRLTEADHPGFGKIYSGRGGYRGHSQERWFCMTDNEDTLYIPRQGDLLKLDAQNAECLIQKVDSDQFVPYREGHLPLPIMSQGIPATLAWLDSCGWFDRVEENVYRFRYDHFLMLGDNTDNSSDGRAWGTIPRLNLVGRAALVWWPFTRRWGVADRLPPLDYESLPTSKDLPPLGVDANE